MEFEPQRCTTHFYDFTCFTWCYVARITGSCVFWSEQDPVATQCNWCRDILNFWQHTATHCCNTLQICCPYSSSFSSPASAPGAGAPRESLECFAVLCVAVLRVLQSCTFLPLMLISTRRARRDCLEVCCSLFLCCSLFYSPRAPLDSQETPLVCCTMLECVAVLCSVFVDAALTRRSRDFLSSSRGERMLVLHFRACLSWRIYRWVVGYFDESYQWVLTHKYQWVIKHTYQWVMTHI